jgi:hypothetical protein
MKFGRAAAMRWMVLLEKMARSLSLERDGFGIIFTPAQFVPDPAARRAADLLRRGDRPQLPEAAPPSRLHADFWVNCSLFFKMLKLWEPRDSDPAHCPEKFYYTIKTSLLPIATSSRRSLGTAKDKK